MKKMVAAIGIAGFVIIVVGIGAFSLGDSGTAKKTSTKKFEATAHSIPPKERKEAMADARRALALLESTRDDTAALRSFLTNPFKKQMREQIEEDIELGRVKIRKLKNIKLAFRNYTKGVSGITLTYTDGSYYVDKATEKRLTKPTNAKEKRVIALSKTKKDKHWRIFSVFGGLKKGVPTK